MSGVLGFLHTAEVHVATFDSILREAAPDVDAIHLVAPDLLERARRVGLDEPALVADIGAALDDLGAQGVDVMVCTCSTIGGAAESLMAGDPDALVRIDRPMATHVVTTARRAALVAAVESTRAPTLALFQEERDLRGSDTEFELVALTEAWALFESGAIEDFHRAIAAGVDALGAEYDAVVLAQASMAGARAYVARPERIVSSPIFAVEAALELL